MPGIDDFHTFKSTSSSSGGSSGGCFPAALIWIIVIAFILYLIGKIGG